MQKLNKIYIHSTLNNTIFSFVDYTGKHLLQMSCGLAGFKKAKRSSWYAIETAVEMFKTKLTNKGFDNILFTIIIKGFNKNSNYAVRNMRKYGINISNVIDLTSLRHGGCKLKKTRRL